MSEANQKAKKERLQKEDAMLKLATKMKKYGESTEDIIRETGLTANEIEKL